MVTVGGAQFWGGLSYSHGKRTYSPSLHVFTAEVGTVKGPTSESCCAEQGEPSEAVSID